MLGGMCLAGCCNEGDVGYDQAKFSWPPEAPPCWPASTKIVEQVASDVNKLQGLKLLFGGNDNLCSNSIRFPADMFPAIKDWVEKGGRLFIVTEHSGQNGGCLRDMAAFNSFSAMLGSSIQYVGGAYPFIGNYQAAGAAIAQGVTFGGNLFGELTGGTPVWRSPLGGSFGDGPGKTIVAVEKIGKGFFFASGDSNHSHQATCKFTLKLLQAADGDII